MVGKVQRFHRARERAHEKLHSFNQIFRNWFTLLFLAKAAFIFPSVRIFCIPSGSKEKNILTCATRRSSRSTAAGDATSHIARQHRRLRWNRTSLCTAHSSRRERISQAAFVFILSFAIHVFIISSIFSPRSIFSRGIRATGDDNRARRRQNGTTRHLFLTKTRWNTLRWKRELSEKWIKRVCDWGKSVWVSFELFLIDGSQSFLSTRAKRVNSPPPLKRTKTLWNRSLLVHCFLTNFAFNRSTFLRQFDKNNQVKGHSRHISPTISRFYLVELLRVPRSEQLQKKWEKKIWIFFVCGTQWQFSNKKGSN